MSYPVYYVEASDTLPHLFDTFDGGDGSSITMTGLAVTDIEIYKDGGTTQRSSDAGYTLLDTDGIDFDSTTGIHGFSIDLSDNTDAGFYAVGSWYHVVVASITVDAQTVNFVACAFRIVSATRGLAGTALPDAAADAAGGLVISDAGGLDVDTMDSNISAILADTGTDGVVIANDAITAAKIADDAIAAEHLAAGAIVAATFAANAITSTVVADNTLTAAKIAADAITEAKIADDAIAAEHIAAGALVTASFGADFLTSALIADDAFTNDHFATDAITGDTVKTVISTAVNDPGAAATTTVFITDLTEATDDHYNGRIIVFTSGALSGQATDITDYDGTTKEVTVTALTEAPADNDTFDIV